LVEQIQDNVIYAGKGSRSKGEIKGKVFRDKNG
jgi:hypothetical protein